MCILDVYIYTPKIQLYTGIHFYLGTRGSCETVSDDAGTILDDVEQVAYSYLTICWNLYLIRCFIYICLDELMVLKYYAIDNITIVLSNSGNKLAGLF